MSKLPTEAEELKAVFEEAAARLASLMESVAEMQDRQRAAEVELRDITATLRAVVTDSERIGELEKDFSQMTSQFESAAESVRYGLSRLEAPDRPPPDGRDKQWPLYHEVDRRARDLRAAFSAAVGIGLIAIPIAVVGLWEAAFAVAEGSPGVWIPLSIGVTLSGAAMVLALDGWLRTRSAELAHARARLELSEERWRVGQFLRPLAATLAVLAALISGLALG